MRRSFYIAVLDLIRCLIGMHVYREIAAQQHLLFIPVDLITDVDLVQITVKADVLGDNRIQVVMLDADGSTDRSLFLDRHLCCITDLPCLLCVIVVDIPGIEVVRAVLIAHDHISALALRQKLSLCHLIINACKLSFFVPGYVEERRFCAGLADCQAALLLFLFVLINENAKALLCEKAILLCLFRCQQADFFHLFILHRMEGTVALGRDVFDNCKHAVS